MDFSLSAATRGNNLLVTIQTPTMSDATDTHTCVVLDISGSMSSFLEMSKGERSNLTRLDIAKHAIKTLIVSCTEKDIFTLITYASNAYVVFESLPMTEENKNNALSKVENIRTGGSTNMWSGMEKAFQCLERTAERFHNQHMMVLTDGDRPNIPRGGFIHCMQEIKARREGKYPCIVHTFGFAYELDSPLLVEIAKEGNGMYSFIPDGSMVGTVFINALSNACTTCAHNVRLMVDTGDAKIVATSAVPTYHRTAGYLILGFPTLADSRKLDIMIRTDRPLDITDLALCLTLNDHHGTEVRLTEFTAVEIDPNRVGFVICHDTTVQTIEKAMHQNETEIRSGLQSLRDILVTMTDNELMEAVDGLIRDVDGQVTEASTNTAYYRIWGRHYLPSLHRAHVLRQCNNFKDPGIQMYSSPLFERIRSEAETQFAKLPAPTPKNYNNNYGRTSSSSLQTAPVDMTQYINRAGGCIHGSCKVWLPDNKFVDVSKIRKGTRTANGGIVKCVVKTPCAPNQEWIQYNGLRITEWHPVFTPYGGWQFPRNIAAACKEVDNSSEFMYSFVMEEEYEQHISVEGIICASLGHGMTHTDVITHEFLGTDKVLKQLRKCRGYEEGEVTVAFTRSDPAGKLDGLLDRGI